MAGSSTNEDEEGGEGYFASVSDLMVGILFIFLLMLTIFALNLRDTEQVARSELDKALAELHEARSEALAAQQRARQEEQRAIAARRDADEQRQEAQRQQAEADRQTRIAQTERDEAIRQRDEAIHQRRVNAELRGLLDQALAELERELQDRRTARDSLLEDLRQHLVQQGIQVVVDRQSGVLRIAGDLLFETGSATLAEGPRRAVAQLAEALAAVLPCFATRQPNCPAHARPVLEAVLVEGHTDRRPVTDRTRFRDNDHLSAERALAVFTELRARQRGLEDLRTPAGVPLLGVSGYGERRPLEDARGDTQEELRRNRRIDIRFILSAPASDELARLRQRIIDVLQAPP
jgi:chemotaxis protein MotB